MLTSKQAEILINLAQEGDFISADDLAVLSGISKRALLYNLQSLKLWLESLNIELVLKPGSGIQLINSNQDRKLFLDLIFSDTKYLNKEERKLFYKFLSIIKDQRIRLEDVSCILKISKETIRRDIKELNIDLERDNENELMIGFFNDSFHITGKENALRNLWIKTVCDIFSEFGMIDYCLWGKSLVNQKDIQKLALKHLVIKEFSWINLRTAWGSVATFRRKTGCQLNDRDHLGLSLYFCIMHWRVQNKHTLDDSDIYPSTFNHTKEMENINSIFDSIEKFLGIKFEINERIIFGLLFYSSQEIFDSTQILQWFPRELYEKASGYLSDLIAITSQKLNLLDVKRMTSAEQKLHNHFFRLMLSIYLDKPINIASPINASKGLTKLFEIVKEVVKDLNEKYSVVLPEQEIIFLTLYLDLIFSNLSIPEEKKPRVIVCCPSGGVTVWYLLERLRQEFPKIEIIDVVSISELSKHKDTQVDAIISTERIDSKKIKVITVSPLITQSEILIITNELFNK